MSNGVLFLEGGKQLTVTENGYMEKQLLTQTLNGTIATQHGTASAKENRYPSHRTTLQKLQYIFQTV